MLIGIQHESYPFFHFIHILRSFKVGKLSFTVTHPLLKRHNNHYSYNIIIMCID